MLGTLVAWQKSRCPSKPANQQTSVSYCRLSDFYKYIRLGLFKTQSKKQLIQFYLLFIDWLKQLQTPFFQILNFWTRLSKPVLTNQPQRYFPLILALFKNFYLSATYIRIGYQQCLSTFENKIRCKKGQEVCLIILYPLITYLE